MKIKSKIDVITNSSSEVFIIKKDDIPFWSKESEGSIRESDFSYPSRRFNEEKESVCAIMGWNIEDTGGKKTGEYGLYYDWDGYYDKNLDTRVEPDWENWIATHEEEIKEKFKEECSFVEIDDHYNYEAWGADTRLATYKCVYKESRH